VAAAYVPLPAWFASIVQVPEAINVAVVPETVQTDVVVEVKVTTRLELAVAESVRGVPTICVPGFAKVIACVARVTNTVPEVPAAVL
jgi:hypothetical protein